MGKRSKRKVKCDEAKPVCERCRRATYNCAGYDQPWLNEAPYQGEAHKRFLVRDQLYHARLDPLLPKEAVVSQGFLPLERLAKELNLSAFQEDICRSFLFHKLCPSNNFSKAASWWLNPTPRAEVQSRTLVSASKAMTAAFFGRVHQQPAIINQATSWYGEALRFLRSDLSHKVKAWTFETLGATLALNMYELIHLTSDDRGYITHAGAIGKLIHVRGPALHKSYPEKEVYLEARVALIANGIFACQRTFLDERKWKDVPWEDDLPAKPLFEYLIDVLSDVPYFLQEVVHANILPATGLLVRPSKESLQKQLLERIKSLKEIREAWHIKHSSPMWPVPIVSTSSLGPDSMRPPFDTFLYFTDMYRAYDHCAFNMTLIFYFLLYQDLSSGNVQPVQDTLPGLFPNGSIQNLVRNICRCTEFLCLEEHGSRGYIVLQMPATIAYLAVDKDSPEAKWLCDVCKRHARRNGFGWGDFAMDQVTPLSQWMASCRDRYRCDSTSTGHFSDVRPCWAEDSEEQAMIGSAFSQLSAASPDGACKNLEGAVSNPS